MITSPMKTRSTSFLSEIETGEPIPEGKLAYLEQRAVNNVYAYVLEKFRDSGVRKSDLARRIGLSQPQINRYLASPRNWTISTVQRLLIGIAGEEVFLRSVPFLNRPPRNQAMLDLHETGDTSNVYQFNLEQKLADAKAA